MKREVTAGEALDDRSGKGVAELISTICSSSSFVPLPFEDQHDIARRKLRNSEVYIEKNRRELILFWNQSRERILEGFSTVITS